MTGYLRPVLRDYRNRGVIEMEIEEGCNCQNCRVGRIEIMLKQMRKDIDKLLKAKR